MSLHLLRCTAAAVALAAGAGYASAETVAMATADLNIRTGPGPEYPVVDVIIAGEQTVIEGCMEGSRWCAVNHNGVEGWAYSSYLSAGLEGSARAVVREPSYATPPPVTYEPSVSYETTTGIESSVIVETPPPMVRTYVRRRAVEPVYLEGRVGVGFGLPETVQVREIPDYRYDYVYVNDRPMLVDPGTRRVVYVMEPGY